MRIAMFAILAISFIAVSGCYYGYYRYGPHPYYVESTVVPSYRYHDTYYVPDVDVVYWGSYYPRYYYDSRYYSYPSRYYYPRSSAYYRDYPSSRYTFSDGRYYRTPAPAPSPPPSTRSGSSFLRKLR